MWLWRVRPVQAGSILQFGVSPYRGPSTALADGTYVAKGVRILHLHLDNRRVAELTRHTDGGIWALAPRLSSDLDALSERVASGVLGQVIAIRGITVLARMAGRFGFEVRPLPRNLRWSLVHSLGGLVMASYRSGDGDESARGLPWPGEVWMSATALQARRGGRESNPLKAFRPDT